MFYAIVVLLSMCYAAGATSLKEMHMRHALLYLYHENNRIGEWSAASKLKAVYGDDALKKTGEWLRKFKSGEKGIEDLEDAPRCGRPSTFDEARLTSVVEEDDTITKRAGCYLQLLHRHHFQPFERHREGQQSRSLGSS